jgi:hypothetical protein
METKSKSYLKQRKRRLAQRLGRLEEHILRGSLVEYYNRCGKPSCKCTKTKGHGPKYYLSTSFPKSRTQIGYVPKEFKGKVQEYLANYQKMKKIIEEICMINRELLRRRTKL